MLNLRKKVSIVTMVMLMLPNTLGVAATIKSNDKTDSSIALETVYVVKEGAGMHLEPDTNSKALDLIKAGTTVQIIGNTEKWLKVEVDKQEGYIQSEVVSDDKAETERIEKMTDNYEYATISSPNIDVRVKVSAEADAENVDSLINGTKVIIIEETEDFTKICYGDDYSEGFVITTSLKKVDEWISKDKFNENMNAAITKKAEIDAKNSLAKSNGYILGENSEAARQNVSDEYFKGEQIVNTALQYLGVPYVWGGTSPSGFDCSGLVQYVCAANGISVNRVACDQRDNGHYIERQNLQPGDLVFFSNGYEIHHVGIYIGDGNMIHAPQTGDVVKISSINTEYRISQYAGAVRVVS